MSDLTSLSIIILGVAIIIMNLAMMRANRRLDARLWRIVKPEIANTAAPTTTELSWPCPRCGSSDLQGHGYTKPAGLTCNVCGWIRYADPYTHTLHDAPTQPPWTTAAP